MFPVIQLKKFENHTRTVTNFHKYGNIGIIDLRCISLKNKSGQSYDPTATFNVIVYGLKGHENDVDPCM